MITRLVLLLLTLSCVNAHAALLQQFTKGSTSRSVEVTILDATTGVPTAGLAFNSSGIDLEYCREATACTDITEVTQTVGGAWTSGGFVSKGHGVYRLDVPDAAFATGVNSVNIQGTITGYIVAGGTVKLVDVNPEDAVRFGMTALPNAAAAASNGLLTSGTGANQLTTSSGAVLLQATQTGVTIPTVTTVGTVNALGNDAIAAADLASDVATEIVASVITALGVNVTTIAARTDEDTFTLTAGSADDNAYNGWAALVIDQSTSAQRELGYVESYVGGTRTIELAADPGVFTIANGDNVVLMPAFMATGVDVSTIEGVDATDQLDTHAAAGLDAAGVRSAIGLGSANLDTQLGDLPTNAELATSQAAADDATLAAIAGQNNLSQANIRTAVGLGSANLDTQLGDLPTNAELATSQAAADDATLAAIDALPTAAENRTALEASTALPVAKYTNAAGDVCTFVISETEPKVDVECTEQ
jgi:hypothetical protein